MKIEDLPREALLELLSDFAKNWLAHDGLWFQAVERHHGLEHAMQLDAEAWARFSPIEARRIRALLQLSAAPGLEGLEEAMNFRLYARLNEQSAVRDGDRLVFTMHRCRVQEARRRRGLPPFPCKEVGVVEYTEFAKAIDPRIQAAPLHCPPDDPVEGVACQWAFTLAE
ncbi:MAG: hypothetical protein JXX28_13050 [Deltaproteobacteria bacterium]|nr:hypothetical protein [Deltaproteobacteria bacterium]